MTRVHKKKYTEKVDCVILRVLGTHLIKVLLRGLNF